LAAYLHTNNDRVLAGVLRRLNRNFNGTLIVSRMETTLLSNFPEVSIALYDVHLRDSLWDRHGRDLLAMKRVYVKASPVSMLSHELEIQEIELMDGSLNLFTDANGYTNGYLLKSRDTSKKTPGKAPAIRHALLKNIRVSINDVVRDKKFGLLIRDLDLAVSHKGDVQALKLTTETWIDGLGFNMERGAFARNKRLRTTLNLTFNTSTRMVDVPLQDLRLNNELVKMAARINLGEDKRYGFRFIAPQIMQREGQTFLAEKIATKVDCVQLSKPISVDASIQGAFRERNPRVHVAFRAVNNVLTTQAGAFTDCSFTGFFDNEYRAGEPRLDPNSIIEVNGFRGTYEGIPITADKVAIFNLQHPHLHAQVKSKFEVTAINDLTGGKTFRFAKGQAALDLRYDGSLSLTDDVVPALYGTVSIHGAEGVYTPRELPLSDINAQLEFKGIDIQFPRVDFRTGTSSIAMNGQATKLLSAMHHPEVPASLRWTVKSGRVDLYDFLPFLQKQAVVRARSKSQVNTPLTDRLNEVLDKADAHLTASLGAAQYGRFQAADIQADVLLTRTHVHLKNASLKHADGKLSVSGDLDQGGGERQFNVKADVAGVDVSQLLATFDNFGQDALTAQNIHGLISLNANLKGKLSKTFGLERQSLTGDLQFDVHKGALVSFTPLVKVGRYIFKRRNLSNLRFEVLKATFHLANDMVVIEPMEVRSSALSLNLVGVYGLQKGTDISFRVPLRNPRRDSVDLARDANYEIGDRGIVVHLRARNTDGRNLKIGWDRNGRRYKALLAKREPEEDDITQSREAPPPMAADKPSTTEEAIGKAKENSETH
jgi:hypothetical protein